MTEEQNKAIREFTGIDRDDFTFDLNAMHEAEAHLQEYWGLYLTNLEEVCNAYKTPAGAWLIVHSSPAQRAKALLKTIGKLVED